MCCFAIYVVMPLPKQNINTSAIQFVVLRLMSLLPPPKQSNIHHHPMCCFEVREVIVTPQAKQHTPPSNVLFWGSWGYCHSPSKTTHTTIQCVVLRFMLYIHSPNKTTYQFTKQSNVHHHPMCCFEVHVVLPFAKQNNTPVHQTKQQTPSSDVLFWGSWGTNPPPHPTPQTKHHISHYYQQLTCCFAVYEIPPLLKQNTTTPAIQCVVLRLMRYYPSLVFTPPTPLQKKKKKKRKEKS